MLNIVVQVFFISAKAKAAPAALAPWPLFHVVDEVFWDEPLHTSFLQGNHSEQLLGEKRSKREALAEQNCVRLAGNGPLCALLRKGATHRESSHHRATEARAPKRSSNQRPAPPCKYLL